MYNNVGGEDWFDNKGWSDEDRTTPHCQWFGITCSEDGLVNMIKLRGNNLTGNGTYAFYSLVGAFKELRVVDVAENKLTGDLLSGAIPTFLKLELFDISGNSFSGHADLLLPSSTLYSNFSHNQFSTVSFKRFNAAYKTLEVLDLSNNNISQDASILIYNIPPNIQELYLLSNLITGTLPDPFPLEGVIRFSMADNNIEGNLPDFPNSAPLLRELDLSNQKSANGEGLNGTITEDIYKLVDLSALNLAGNSLTGEIPISIGNLAKLKLLNLSSNMHSEQIPSELGRLVGTCLL